MNVCVKSFVSLITNVSASKLRSTRNLTLFSQINLTNAEEPFSLLSIAVQKLLNKNNGEALLVSEERTNPVDAAKLFWFSFFA